LPGLLKHIISVGCIVALLLANAATAEPVPITAVTAGSGDKLIQQLQALQRTQNPDGSFEFQGTNKFFETYPVMATLALGVYRNHPSPALASQFLASAARYYKYLFTNRDRNANLLVETPFTRGDGTLLTGVEDPGFNGLLSLDMISMALLNLEIRKPLQALYWYEGARTLQDGIASECFDPAAGYFFPYDNNSGDLIRDYVALSTAPLLFETNIGDNHAGTLLHYYALQKPDVSPEPPYLYVDHPKVETAPDESLLFNPGYLLKSLFIAEVLDSRGFADEASRSAKTAADRVAADTFETAQGKQPAATAGYLTLLLESGQFHNFRHPLAALDLFEALVRYKRRLADNELVRLGKNVTTIRSFVETGGDSRNLKNVEDCIRDIYWGVSKTRGQLRANKFYDREDFYRTSGLELVSATDRLLDDVVSAMRRVENLVYRERSRETGLSVSATLLNERALIDQKVKVKWVVANLGSRPVEIKSAQVIRGQEADSLIGPANSMIVRPGEPQSFVSSFPARRGKPGTLIPWTFTLSMTTREGDRLRYNAFRTLYLEQPLQAAAGFPGGQILQGLSMPIHVQVVKKTGARANIECGWYSAAGLQLKEGKRFGISMDAEQDTAHVVINVMVPSPCRPGSFPFKLKFFNEGKDLGTINSSFFKPYQWLFLGPFEASELALSTPYPPEKAVDLRKGYGGIGRRIMWQVLPEASNANYGEVHLRGAMNPSGVGYLYTVVESSHEKESPLFFAANKPAAVFFNGERVLNYQPGPDRMAVSKTIKVRDGMNNILIKIIGDPSSRIFFKLGDDGNMASDEFNNNLWELVGDFGEFQERSRQIQQGETEDVQRVITLRYSDPDANSVSVIGTFNGWSPENARMRKSPGGGWEITLSLRPGKYAYRFLVNNRKQVLDPECLYEEPDGYGGKNSVVYVKQ
jgi:hypothetical protein